MPPGLHRVSFLVLSLLPPVASTAGHDHGTAVDRHSHELSATDDPRTAVDFPPPMRRHLLSNMRDHLDTLARVQAALAAGEHERASALAEQRLGMTSLTLHGAHDAARHMPEGMRELGSAMHRQASRFAVSVQDAAVTGDLRPALSSLAELTGACASCHAAYRLAD
ncbi:hypothetical protein [Methyloversatilis sp.]|uniref:hypothetical protein n=1 Tax=Methyloversatilis sp. TaxID=2569862 RepID=UPI0035ADAA3C